MQICGGDKMGGDDMSERMEEIISELLDEMEKAQRDSLDLLKNGMNGEQMTYYAMGLLKAVRIIRGMDKKEQQA